MAHEMIHAQDGFFKSMKEGREGRHSEITQEGISIQGDFLRSGFNLVFGIFIMVFIE
jgi:hypothetical protein